MGPCAYADNLAVQEGYFPKRVEVVLHFATLGRVGIAVAIAFSFLLLQLMHVRVVRPVGGRPVGILSSFPTKTYTTSTTSTGLSGPSPMKGHEPFAGCPILLEATAASHCPWRLTRQGFKATES